MLIVKALWVASFLMPIDGWAQTSQQQSVPTVIYFVRHGEVDSRLPTFPLNEAGKRRAEVFARTVRDVAFTLILSSHTTRARQMVEPTARERQLPVRQLPEPGARLDDSTVVSDGTQSRVAVQPLLDALRAVPEGSRVLVGVNSDNIYALLHGLGARLASTDQPCTPGSACVPCLTNACFPGGEDQLWILVITPGSSRPALIELRYGSTVP